MPIRILRHYINLPVLLLGALEFTLLAASVYAGLYLRFAGNTAAVDELGPIYPRAAVYGVVMMAALIAMGLYQVRTKYRLLGVLLRMGAASVIAGIALSIVFYAVPAIYLGRGVLGLSLIVSFILLAFVRMLFYRVVDDDMFKRRVLFYGAGEKAASLLDMPMRYDVRGFSAVGFVHPPGSPIKVNADRILSVEESLCEYARRHDIDEVVVAIDDRRKGFPIQQLLDCKLGGIAVTDVISFVERETGRVKLDLLYPSWMIFSEGFSHHPFEAFTRRLFDLIAALALLAVTWPIMLVTAIAIWCESYGRDPILYRQRRVGRDGDEFEVLKFRSMHVDAESEGRPVWAQENDSRVTRTGAVIRKYRIDELPQIFNVLRGDMSFVGPRPERPAFVTELSRKIPYYRERHSVKPGITGWAQLCYRYGASDDDALEKLQYDLYYVKNRSLLFDLMILLQTAEVVLWRQGSR